MLKYAIEEAWKYQFLTYPNPAVGACVIVKNEVFIDAHKKAGAPHAEVNALWKAFSHFHKTPSLNSSHEIHDYLIKHHNNFFKDATIYITLEPCAHIGKTPACANLIKELKPKKVIIGQKDPISSHSGGANILKNVGIDVKILNDKDSYNLIEPFIKWSNDRFIFFKLAQTLNGVITGGYISSETSLNWVHQVRDKIDLLVIGGNSVRVDRPTLDARRVNGKAPDILIYSKSKNFDKNIPLFNIKNRNVFTENNLDKTQDYNFIMIEGGINLYSQIKDIIDWSVFIISPKMNNLLNYQAKSNFNIIYSYFNKKDVIIFSEK